MFVAGFLGIAGFAAYGAVLLGALYAVKLGGEWAEERLPPLVHIPLIIAMVAAWCCFAWISWQVLSRFAGVD